MVRKRKVEDRWPWLREESSTHLRGSQDVLPCGTYMVRNCKRWRDTTAKVGFGSNQPCWYIFEKVSIVPISPGNDFAEEFDGAWISSHVYRFFSHFSSQYRLGRGFPLFGLSNGLFTLRTNFNPLYILGYHTFLFFSKGKNSPFEMNLAVSPPWR